MGCSTQECKGPIDRSLEVFDKEEEGYRFYSRVTNCIEIVQGGDDDTVYIEYSGSDKPSEITFEEKTNGSSKKIPFSGNANHKCSYIYKMGQYRLKPGNELKSFFTFVDPPTLYTVKGFKSPIYVKAYNPDQWMLTIKFPAMKGYKAGAVMDNKKESIVVVNTDDMSVSKASTEAKSITLTASRSGFTEVKSMTIEASYERYCATHVSPKLAMHQDIEVRGVSV